MAADWSELTPDLTGEIAKTICRIEDFIVFSSVCPSWRLASVRENWVSDDRQLPWLVLSEPVIKEEEEEEDPQSQWCRGFFNLNNNKRYDLHVPNFRGCKVFGSNHGWIFTFNLHCEMHLINPLSGIKLSFPHYTTFKHYKEKPSSAWYRDYFIRRALVFKRRDEVFVAAIYGEFDYLAIAKPGDQSWTEVEFESRPFLDDVISPFLDDVICFNDQLFAIEWGGWLLHCQLDGPEIPKLTQVSSPPIGFDIGFTKLYLVESMTQLLFLVQHITREANKYYKTTSFDVYKFDFENNKWAKLDSLGDSALFVGNSYSMSLSSAKVSACQRNSIYFDNFIGWRFKEEGYGGHDMGIYNLDEHVFHLLPYSLDAHDIHSTFSSPVWMMPSLF